LKNDPTTHDAVSKNGDMGEENGYEADPLDELLDAYQSAVKWGPKALPLIEPILSLTRKVEALYRGMAPEEMESAMTMTKGMGMEKPSNPLESLIYAYMGMLYIAGSEELRNETLELIRMADRMIMGTGLPEEEEKTPVVRTIKEENGMYVVYSTTGRKFGTYPNRKKAEERLSMIERFSKSRIQGQEPRDLAIWRASLESLPVTAASMTVLNLIDDELEALGETAKTALIAKAVEEQRYTLGPVYVPGVEDAHGEFTDADTLRKGLWGWVRKGNRTIYLQHSEKAAGEMVEVLTMPWAVTASLTVPNEGTTEHTFPAETPFMGVVWEPWAWELVKSGKLRGYSIGGRANRVEVDLPIDATV